MSRNVRDISYGHCWSRNIVDDGTGLELNVIVMFCVVFFAFCTNVGNHN